MISKDTFVKALNQIKTVNEYTDKFNDWLTEYGGDGCFYPPTCTYQLVMALEEGMELERNENGYTDISYFVYDLDCGKRWKEGCATDVVNGQEINIDISTPEKLYDYLIGKKYKAGETTE